MCHSYKQLKLNYTERNCKGGVDNKKTMKGLGIYKNTSTLEETTVLPIGINCELQRREREREVKRECLALK